MTIENRRHGIMALALIFSLSAVFLLWYGCGGGGGGGDSGTTPTKSVVITGTVPGTVAIAYNASTGIEAARSVASGTPKRFSLNVAPGDYYLMFIENEGTPTQRNYAFQNVTGGNVFTCKANTTLDLGILVYDNFFGTAKPQIDPISGNDNVTENVTPPADFSGEWIATRKFLSSTCSGHSPGTTVTDNVTIAQGFGIVTFNPAGTTDVLTGVANVNTVILTEYWQSAPYSALVTVDLTKQSDGFLAGTYSKVGYGGECSEDGTITAVWSSGVPAQVAGYWKMVLTDGEISYFSITQNGNNIAGQVLCGSTDTFTGTIYGNSISFSGTETEDGSTFNCSGTVNVTTIQGTCSATDTGTGDWTATLQSQAPTDKQCVIDSTRVSCINFPNNSQYWVNSLIEDPNAIVQSANISGSNITGTSPYTYNLYPDQPGRWWTNPNIFISTGTPPTFPLNYSVSISFKDATSTNVSRTVTTCEVAQ